MTTLLSDLGPGRVVSRAADSESRHCDARRYQTSSAHGLLGARRRIASSRTVISGSDTGYRMDAAIVARADGALSVAASKAARSWAMSCFFCSAERVRAALIMLQYERWIAGDRDASATACRMYAN